MASVLSKLTMNCPELFLQNEQDTLTFVDWFKYSMNSSSFRIMGHSMNAMQNFYNSLTKANKK
jgi:hypothetical protein